MTRPTTGRADNSTEPGSVGTPSRRDRLRKQTQDDAKAVALEQLRAGGAAAISLNAIGKQLGMSGPALYRYFTGWDGLLTELISDAYRDLALAVESAAVDLPAVAAAMRRWALNEPHRYLLIFGTPIPGYQAPPETVDLARRVMATLINSLPNPEQDLLGSVPLTAMRAWTRLHGVISLELAGHFDGMGFNVQILFDAEIASLINEKPSR